MADSMFFSRDSKVFVAPLAANGAEVGVWEVPVLDGFSFSQATNSSEVTLNEMSGGSNASRRGRKMFNDSLAPAEWSFSTYARPFRTTGSGAGKASDTSGDHHAVEEALWALAIGDGTYDSNVTSSGAVASLSSVVTFTALSGDNKLGADATFTVNTTTDGDGGGAQILLTYTESSGAIVATLGAEKGSDYTASDKVFIGRATLASALGTALANVVTNDSQNDFEATVASIANASGGTSFQGFTRGQTELAIDFTNSNKSTLGKANIYFTLGSTAGDTATTITYKVANCCMNEVGLDFDIDGITTINWSGMGSTITEQASAPTRTVYEAVESTSNFIRNRLTELVASSASPTSVGDYDLTLTGGSITISNNMSFLTPETLGVVNTPLDHVTGTRSISGSFTCYLNKETNSSMDLFDALISGTSTVTNDFDLSFKIGGSTAGTARMEYNMPNCHLEIPTHSIDDVISVEVSFHALGTDIDDADELTVKYIGA